MPLPPLLSSRSTAEQILVANILPCAFGALTGWMLGVSEIVYLVLAVPIGLLGGFFAGLEHRGGPEGAVRGFFGGLQFGVLILAVHELTGLDATAHLPEPAVLLAVITTVIGAILGFLGGLVRARHMRTAQ